MFIHVYIYIYIYIYVYTHIHIHIHIHTYQLYLLCIPRCSDHVCVADILVRAQMLNFSGPETGKRETRKADGKLTLWLPISAYPF